jgi:hypothetical protein
MTPQKLFASVFGAYNIWGGSKKSRPSLNSKVLSFGFLVKQAKGFALKLRIG